MFKHACGVGPEDVVSKVRDSRYVSGRGNDWIKKTCAQRETLPIAGFAMKDNQFDGIYVAMRKGDDWVYAGKVDHGFDKSSTVELQARLKPLIRKTSPMQKRLRTAASGSSHRCWPRSSTGPSPPRARCGIPFSKVSERICKTKSV
jgi:bifunctional non-homologous end joining protein LigD